MKNVFIIALATVGLALGSCSDWTKTENLEYNRLTPAEADPTAYKQYLAALRDYKNSEHQVTMVTVMGVEAPTHQREHLTSLPDSVDYIMVKGITELSPVIVGEMTKVRDEKGTKVFCVVDYASIVESWNALWQGTVDNPDAADSRTPEEFAAYCAEQTNLQLSHFDKYGFDGIEISYLGNRGGDLGQKGQDAFMSNIATWRGSHSNAQMIFRGFFGNLIDQTILTDCIYLVAVPGNNATTITQMDIPVQRELNYITDDDIKKTVRDRIVYEVAIPDITNPQQTGVTLQVAATWAVTPLPDNTAERNMFIKRGIAIDNAADDYYNVAMIYRNIRQAIGIMTHGLEQETSNE
jgi:hypothetical protein